MKKLFLIDYVSIYIFSKLLSIDFEVNTLEKWGSPHIGYMVIH